MGKTGTWFNEVYPGTDLFSLTDRNILFTLRKCLDDKVCWVVLGQKEQPFKLSKSWIKENFVDYPYKSGYTSYKVLYYHTLVSEEDLWE